MELQDETSRDDEALFNQLRVNEKNLLSFLAEAIEHIQWREKHSLLFSLSYQHLTKRFEGDRLDISLLLSAVRLVREYPNFLVPLLPKTFQFKTSEGVFSINSLLIGASSPLIARQIKRGVKEIHESKLEPGTLLDAIAFLETSNDLFWKLSEASLEGLLDFSERFEITSLKEKVEEQLIRFVRIEGCLDTLVQAMQKNRPLLAERAMKLLNEKQPSVYLKKGMDALSLTFMRFDEEAERIFSGLSSVIDTIGYLEDEARVFSIIEKARNVTALDLHRAKLFPPFLENLPKRIDTFILKDCAWLDDQALQNLASQMPGLHRLDLSRNQKITKKGLLALKNFTSLTSLCLAFCKSIDRGSLSVVVRGVRSLEELDLIGCQNLDEEALDELTHLEGLKKLSIPFISRESILNLLEKSHLEELVIDRKEENLASLDARYSRCKIRQVDLDYSEE